MSKQKLLIASGILLALQGTQVHAMGDITINGFLTAAATYSDGKHDVTDTPIGYRLGLADSELNTDTRDNRLGIQIAAPVNDTVSLTAQLLAKGGEMGYNVTADWAYASINLDDNFDLRIGKVKVPQFLVSDYLEVGYAYPWLRPPVEVYSTNPIVSLSGVDLLFYKQVDDVGFTFQLYAGGGNHTTLVPAPSVDITRQIMAGAQAGDPMSQAMINGGLLASSCSQNLYLYDYATYTPECVTMLPVKGDVASFTTNKMVGFNFSVANDYATFRIGYFSTRVDAPAFGLYDKFGSFGGVGFSLDWNDLVILSEYISRDTEKDMIMEMAFPDQTAGYVTLGYRIEDFLPYATYSMIDEGNDKTTMGVELKQTSTSIGMRYEMGPAAALKFEATQVTPEKGNHGLYDSVGVKTGNVVGVSMDFIF